MSDTQQAVGSGAQHKPVFQRRWFWLVGVIVLGLAVVVPSAWAFRGLAGARMMRGFGGHGSGAALHDPETAKRHIGVAIEFALRGVGANEDQQQQVQKVAERTIDQLAPLVGKHREYREAMARELARPEIDRAAIERLRKEQVALADQASKTIVAGVTDAASALTPEQRTQLIELAHRFHGEGAIR